MSNFFSKFPLTTYSFDPKGQNIDMITNILFRTKLFGYIRNNTTAYYDYTLKEYETPEIIAEKYYGTPDAYWLVLYANDVVDPQYDWLLDTNSFNEYIISKYGSIANAMTQVHHYQKIIQTVDSGTGISTFKSYEVDLSDPRTIPGDTTLPYDTYDNLAGFYDVNPQGTFSDGSGMQMFITKNSVSCYDYEYDLNEAKRSIKLIRKEYWPQIQNEFQAIVNAASPSKSYIRTIKSV